MTTHGATLGKYAPLHSGHQEVIERALTECDRVTVVIYDAPSTTRVPLSVRAARIRELYPTVTVLEGWAGPEGVGPEHQATHDAYLRELGLRDVTHFYSCEAYGAATAAALGAIDRRGQRSEPTATEIRRHPYAHRHLLSPRVYRDLVANVAIMGAPSSGKSTLAGALATAFDTAWMPEYGREFWFEHQVDRRLTPEQLVELAEGHLVREEALLWEADGFLFTDTTALTTWLYGVNYHGSAPPLGRAGRRLRRPLRHRASLRTRLCLRRHLGPFRRRRTPAHASSDPSRPAHPPHPVLPRRRLAGEPGGVRAQTPGRLCPVHSSHRNEQPMEWLIWLVSVDNVAFTVLGYPLSWVELVGTVLYAWSVWLISRRRMLTWPVGILSVLAFLAIFVQIRLYSDALEQVYYLIVSVYGWITWRAAQAVDPEPAVITRFSHRPTIIWTAALTVVSGLALGLLMGSIHQWLPSIVPAPADFPVVDALTTVASFVAMFLLAKRRTEAWVYWITVDVVVIWLYWVKDVKFLALLYVMLLGMAINGLLVWRRQATAA